MLRKTWSRKGEEIENFVKHRFCHHYFNFSINLNLILNFYFLSSYFTKMVQTRSQLENLSKEELIEELISVISVSDLSNQFDDF